MKWLPLLALASSPAMAAQVLPPKMTNVNWQIHLTSDDKDVTSGNCTIEYKGIVLASSSFKGQTSFEAKGMFKLRADARQVQVRCAVNGYKTYTETVAVTADGVHVEHCLGDNARIYQQPVVDLASGVARVHLKFPQFRREKVLVNNKTFLQLTTPDEDVLSASYTGEPYLPELPQTSFYFALPLDAQVTGISVKPYNVIDGINMLLVPQANQSVGDINPIAVPVYNEKVYYSKNPEIQVGRDASFQAIVDREKNLVRVSVPLVDYSVKLGTVRFYDEADVIVSFKANSRCFRKPFWGRDAVDTLRAGSLVGLKNLVLNPDDIQSVCRPSDNGGETPVIRTIPLPQVENPISLSPGIAPLHLGSIETPLTFSPNISEVLRQRLINPRALALTSGPNLVIITDPKFHAQAVDLAAHKESIGIRTAVMDWTVGASAQDLKAQLQKAADALRPNYMQWVLLLGDVDSIPTFYDDGPDFVQIGDEAHTAGDAYYVQWSNAGAYVPSQDPDSSIGRIPAKSVEELKYVIERIKNYDNNPSTSDTYYSSPTIAGTMQLKSTDKTRGAAGNYAYAVETYLADKFFGNGFRPERIYRTDDPNFLKPTYWQGNTLIDYDRLTAPQSQTPTLLFHMDGAQEQIDKAIQRGTNMLVHRGHGSIDQWLAPAYRFDAQRFAQIPERMPPVVFALSCLTGFFDNETVRSHILAPTSDVAPSSPEQRYLGEQMLLSPKGALGVVASSRQSASAWNSTMTKGLARSVAERRIDADTALSQRLGDIMTDAKVYTKKSNTAINPTATEVDNRHHMLAYNLLGDPSVEMRQSMPLAVRGTPTLSYDAERATVTVRFRIESTACSPCDLNQQQEQPIAVLMGGENQPVSRGIASVIRSENGENREVVLSNVRNFNSASHTLYLSNAGLATYRMVTGPTIPVIR